MKLVIPKLLGRFHPICWSRERVKAEHPGSFSMPFVIQSRAVDELAWTHEVWRRNRFHAYLTAKAKAQLTGRVYRLLDDEGIELERVHHQGSAEGSSSW